MTVLLNAWTRSSRCDSGHCVEVARDGDQIQVRDSKNPDPRIYYSSSWWQMRCGAMRRAYADGERSHWLPSAVSRRAGGYVWHKDGVTLRFTSEEWEAHVDGVLAGEFDVDKLAAVACG